MFPPDATRALAAAVVALVLSALLVGFIRHYRRTQYATLPEYLFYLWNFSMARVLWRTSISQPLPIGARQGAVVVCNHIGPIDPSFVGLTCWRTVHWMVAEEYCRRGPVGWALRTLRVIPTNRSGIDTRSTKLAIRHAEQGELVGIFPEGRINTTSRLLLPGRPGAALIALKARVPIIPCFLKGSPNDGTTLGFLFMSAHVRLEVGSPLDFSEFHGREGDREVLGEVTRRMLKEIARLAGHPNYEPELAGRQWKPTAIAEPASEEGSGTPSGQARP